MVDPCSIDAIELAKLSRKTIDLSSPGIWSAPNQEMRDLTERIKRYFAQAPPPTGLNTAVAYVYGRCAFDEMADALATATSPEHRIYVAGWWGEPWTRLKYPRDGQTPPNTLLQDYLNATRAQIRALYWDTPNKHVDGDSKAIVDFINALPHGLAIEDAKVPRLNLPWGPGAHHQKLLIVLGSSGLIAFLGGMDLVNNRIATDGSSPLHDVHLRITGPAAAAILEVFSGRWLDNGQALAAETRKFSLSTADLQKDFARVRAVGPEGVRTATVPSGRARHSDLLVSIGTTYANLGRFRPGERYPFAPEGSDTAWRLIRNGIREARGWIYLEDQYLVSRRARAELLKKVSDPRFGFLLILMGDSRHFHPKEDKIGDVGEFPYLTASRNEFRLDLMKVDPKRRRWRMFNLVETSDDARRPWAGHFVHSKTWIFDDLVAITGSANCDDRGYSYDSEIVAAVTDSPLARAAGSNFARDLRIALWHKHLGAPHKQLQDFDQGLKLWKSAASAAMIADASELEEDPLIGKELVRSDPSRDRVWTHLIDPDGDGRPAGP